jgi:outer membrane protein OmpA-like peptidoglycan-associated protein
MKTFLLFSIVFLNQFALKSQLQALTSKIPPYRDSLVREFNSYTVQYQEKKGNPPKIKDNIQKFTCYFSYNKSDFAIDSVQKLKNWLNQYHGKRNVSISLVAYTDTIGSVYNNNILAKKRLNSITNRLKSYPIPTEKRFFLGENYPYVNNVEDKYLRKVDVYVEFDNDENINPEQLGRMEIFASATPQIPINLNIQFVGNQDVYLNESSILEVVTLLEFLKKNPNKKAFIRGHVCCANDVELSTKRAMAVYNDLLLEGIDKSRISFQGFGNSLPISLELDEETRQLNRRVDVVFSDLK